MNILILQGSPVANGSTHILAEAFKQGAEAMGHACQSIETATANIAPCSGCLACGYEGPCAQHDDMERLRGRILSSDLLAFVTPLYYYGMNAQLKTVIDRFCSFNTSLMQAHKQSVLIAAAWNGAGSTFDALMAHYAALVEYLQMEDRGVVLGYGCGTPAGTQRSVYITQAYDLGKSL